MREISNREIRIDKYTDSKGVFHNTTDPFWAGEIELYNCTERGWFEDVFNEKCKVCYMELGRIKGFGFRYQGKAPYISIGAPQISIGDYSNNIPIEDRIKFLYESLSSNYNYNCLGIIYKDMKLGEYKESLFTIEFGDEDGVLTIYINNLWKYGFDDRYAKDA